MLEQQEVLDLAKLAWHGHVLLRTNCSREIALAMATIPDWSAIQQAWRFDGFAQGMLYVLGDKCPDEQKFIQGFTETDLGHIREAMATNGTDLYQVQLPDEGISAEEILDAENCPCDDCKARRALAEGGIEGLQKHMDGVLEQVDKRDPHEAEFQHDLHLAIEAAIKETLKKHGRSEEKHRISVGSVSSKTVRILGKRNGE